MSNESFKVGDLVIDTDPYKAPEIYYGHGIVTKIISPDHVVVHWPKKNMSIAVKIEYIKKIIEIKP